MYNSTGRSGGLRYYMHDGPDAFRFELTGRLSKDAARDLEQAWRTAESTIGKRLVIIDLSGLTGIDRHGHELLDRWARRCRLFIRRWHCVGSNSGEGMCCESPDPALT